jgi:hypothetical protein
LRRSNEWVIFPLRRIYAIHKQNGDCTVRLGESAQKCVVFFGVQTMRAPVEYGGTGFLISGFEPDWPEAFPYLLTARHVAETLEQHEDTGFYIRANLKAGGSEVIQVTSAKWSYHEDPTVDLALAGFHLHPERYDQVRFKINGDSIVDHEAPHIVEIGDTVSVVGLFRLHAGSRRSLPIAHTGNVALLPDKIEKVPVRDRRTDKVADAEVFLIEAQTLDGLSGAPVFMHRMVELKNYKPLGSVYPRAFSQALLLGLYSGSWDAEPGVILAADRNLRGGQRVPVGMGTVVPAKKIVELLESSGVKQGRRKYIDARKSETAATMDSALSAPVVLEDDAPSPK